MGRQIVCPKCKGKTGIKRSQLWYPEQPAARLKCRKCGEWSRMDELAELSFVAQSETKEG
jgi:uncharacterized protein YbaR (Trm112 family)